MFSQISENTFSTKELQPSKSYKSIFHGQWKCNCCNVYIFGNCHSEFLKLQKMDNGEVLKKNITNHRINKTIKLLLSIWGMAVNFKGKRKAEIYSVCCDDNSYRVDSIQFLLNRFCWCQYILFAFNSMKCLFLWCFSFFYFESKEL